MFSLGMLRARRTERSARERNYLEAEFHGDMSGSKIYKKPWHKVRRDFLWALRGEFRKLSSTKSDRGLTAFEYARDVL